jgi:hypothetical protein
LPPFSGTVLRLFISRAFVKHFFEFLSQKKAQQENKSNSANFYPKFGELTEYRLRESNHQQGAIIK